MNIPELIGDTAICAEWILEACQKDLAGERGTSKPSVEMPVINENECFHKDKLTSALTV